MYETIFAIVLLIAAYVLSTVLAKPPPTQNPSKLTDFNVPTVAEGTPQTVVFGEVWCSAWTVLFYGDFHVTPTKSGGGKK